MKKGVPHTRCWVRVSPMVAHMCTNIWIKKRLGCHAYYQEVSRCRKRGEAEESIAQYKQGIHPGFKTQDRHHQKFKTGVSMVPQKASMSSKLFK